VVTNAHTTDALIAANILCFGPSAKAAQIEASKAFSKDFMARHNIPTARYQNFKDAEAAYKYIDSLDYNIVVKASGLAAGKGRKSGDSNFVQRLLTLSVPRRHHPSEQARS
jgi:phosphoribosylamine-glycine ligase